MIIIKGLSVAGDASALAEWAGVQWVLTRRSDAQCRHLGEVAQVAGNERPAVFELCGAAEPRSPESGVKVGAISGWKPVLRQRGGDVRWSLRLAAITLSLDRSRLRAIVLDLSFDHDPISVALGSER